MHHHTRLDSTPTRVFCVLCRYVLYIASHLYRDWGFGFESWKLKSSGWKFPVHRGINKYVYSNNETLLLQLIGSRACFLLLSGLINTLQIFFPSVPFGCGLSVIEPNLIE